MGELEDRISGILDDPEQMSRIANLAKSLMGESAAPGQAENAASGGLPDLSRLAASFFGGEAEPDPALLGRLSRLLRSSQSADRRQQALLEAMKPYLSEKRRSKMDRAVRLAHVAKLAQLAMGELGGEQDV